MEFDVLIVGAGRSGLAAATAARDAGARRVAALDKAPVDTVVPGVDVRPSAMVHDLILSPEGEAAGVLVVDPGGRVREYRPFEI